MITHRNAAPVKASRWPLMIFGLIGLNMCIVAITVFYATRDPSVATEPDYYTKALGYEKTIVQRQANERLGWTARPELSGGSGNAAVRSMLVTLADKEGKPITDAKVTVEAFASARSGQRQSLTLSQVNAETGTYAAPIRIPRAGVWEVRIKAEKGVETFTRDTDLMVPGLSK